MKKIYLDNNATTPLDKSVLAEMQPYFADNFANPSSQHFLGQQVKQAVESARELTAQSINAIPEEVIFTSGGTEANNLAIQGIANAYLDTKSEPGHIISNRVEHSCVLSTLKHLERQGWKVTYVGVDQQGNLNTESIKSAIQDNTCLISIMMANNETGVIHDLAAISAIAHARGIPVHTDAVQALGKIPVDVHELDVDLLSLSAHKFNGPKGSGALYCKKRLQLKPVLFGGGQERGLKPGTENVPAIIGLSSAIDKAAANIENYKIHTRQLTALLREGISESIDEIRFNGNETAMLPNTLNVSFTGIDAVSLHSSLDARGICAGTGAACSSATSEVSHVLKWMKISPKYTFSAIRFSLGKQNTQDDIEKTLPILIDTVKELRCNSGCSGCSNGCCG